MEHSVEILEKKKAFALNAIKPYAKDPTLCGYATGSCMNITSEGKMCVAGKYMKPEFREQNPMGSIGTFLQHNSQEEIFIEEAQNILDRNEWGSLQSIHDMIAVMPKTPDEGFDEILKARIKALNLFTYEEMMA